MKKGARENNSEDCSECCSCSNSCGIVSVILGILSLVFPFTVLIFGFASSFVLSITGIIFGVLQYRCDKNKWATWGIILNAIALILSIIIAIWFVSAVGAAIEQMAALQASGLTGVTNG